MTIIMGNDETILYVRKNCPASNLSTAQIGRKVWVWIRRHGGQKEQANVPCRWGNSGNFINNMALPKTATQFRFNPTLLPQLYSFLNTL